MGGCGELCRVPCGALRRCGSRIPAAVAEANAFSLEHIERAQVRDHCVRHRVAAALPLSHGLPVPVGAGSKVFDREPASARPARIWAPVIRTSNMAIILRRRWFPSTAIKIAAPAVDRELLGFDTMPAPPLAWPPTRSADRQPDRR